MAPRIKIDPDLFERVRKIVERADYSSPEEFIIHVIETELAKLESADSDSKVTDRLRGLGYIE